jgi:creatinine amidohydrolase
MPVHRLVSLTWQQFADLPRERLVAILPLGAIEAHGPHLPLGTDLVIAEAMARDGARRLSDRGFDVVIVPALAFSPAPFAAAFAGTLNTAAEATTTLVAGVACELHRHGVKAVGVANAHHDPAHVAAIRRAVDAVLSEPGVRLVFPDLTRREWAARLTDEFRSGACHAGRYEGSIVLAESPDDVDHEVLRRLAPNPASLVEAIRRGDTTFAQAGGPEAYFGWPADATAEEGRGTIAALGAIVEAAVLAAWDTPPHPTTS